MGHGMVRKLHSDPRMQRRRRRVLVVALLALGSGGALALAVGRPPHPTSEFERKPPRVRVTQVEFADVEVTVRAQGSVVPRTESDLVAEVSGRVVRTSPALAGGGFFSKGKELAAIEAHDYRVAVRIAEAAVQRLASGADLASQRLARQRLLNGRGVGSPSFLDESRAADQMARAELQEAEALLAQARKNLERTVIRAPFDGRVRQKHVDVGQFVSAGAAIARIYSVDYAEIRLPVPDRDFAFLDVPLDFQGRGNEFQGPRVTLRADFVGRKAEWHGRVVRTEGEIDARTRMIHLIARFEDPYGRQAERSPDHIPLAVGLFVDAEIEGRIFQKVVLLPRSVLRGEDQVLVVDDENRLRFRRVDVLRAGRDEVLLRGGLAPGERVVLVPNAISIDGSRVIPVAEATPPLVAHTDVAP